MHWPYHHCNPPEPPQALHPSPTTSQLDCGRLLSTLVCSSLHYTSMHCIALHCDALNCTARHCTALHWW